MIAYIIRRYGPLAALVFIAADVLVAYLVGSRIVAWEMTQLRDMLGR